jgi:hypothetical protein
LTSQSLATTSVPPTYHSNHSGISSNHSNSYDRDNQPSHSSRQSRDSQRSYDLISYRSEDDFIPEKNTSALPTVCYEPWAYVADDSLQVSVYCLNGKRNTNNEVGLVNGKFEISSHTLGIKKTFAPLYMYYI